MNSPSNTTTLSSTASDRKRAGLTLVLAAQHARVRSRRIRRAAIASVGTVAVIAVAVVLSRPAPIGMPAVPAPRIVLEKAPAAPARGPVVVMIRNDSASLASARIDDTQLRALLTEAGEPAGIVRMGGRAFAERELLVAQVHSPNTSVP